MFYRRFLFLYVILVAICSVSSGNHEQFPPSRILYGDSSAMRKTMGRILTREKAQSCNLACIREKFFYSNALNRKEAYRLYIPEDTCPAAGWPLLVILHGLGRNHKTLTEVGGPEVAALIENQPFAILFANGRAGWWYDSPVDPNSRYQSMVRELLYRCRENPLIDPAPARTGIWGWSMGGFGAVRFAEDYPDEVAAVAATIGLLDFPNPVLPPRENFKVPEHVFGGHPEHWKQINCMQQAARLSHERILLVAAEKAFDYRMNVHFHRKLQHLKITHQFEILSGGHTFETVIRSLPVVFDFMRHSLCSEGPKNTIDNNSTCLRPPLE